MIRAIFFDIDGTLISFTTHQISPAVMDSLHHLRKKGIKLFLATGRHKSMIKEVLDLFPFDGCITLNGQYCFCGSQVLRSVPLHREDVKHIVKLTSSGAFPCIFLAEEDSYINEDSPQANVFPQQLSIPLPRLDDPRLALTDDLYQVVAFLTKDREHLLTDHTRLLNPMRWHPDFIDVIAAGGGKDKGMDAILEHFHIPLEQSMAFGDGENDLSMLVHAGIGVAMGSASDTVKSQADYVTGTAEEDGIITALQHFGLL